MEQVVYRVRQVIDRSGLLMGEFASTVGLDGPKLSKSLSGARKFTLAELGRIADFGHVRIDWLAGAPLDPAPHELPALRRSEGPAVAWSPLDHPEAIALSQTQWWEWAVQLCASRMRQGQGRQQQIDARFFVIALAQLRTCVGLGLNTKEYPGGVAAELEAQLLRFDQEIPGIKEARDVLTHLDAYSVGSGNMQVRRASTSEEKRDLARRYTTPVGYYPADDEVRVGAVLYRFRVDKVLDALPQLSWAVYRAGLQPS